MNLLELVEQAPAGIDRRTDRSVPDEFIGVFRRNSISFSNGLSDFETKVYWLQSRNFTIDIRLPVEQHIGQDETEEEHINEMLDYEGWMASSLWRDEKLSWEGGVSYQIENRWPEKAILHRVGNSFVEFAPSGAYVEDWRLQPSTSGPIVALSMTQETNSNGEITSRGGGLFVLGDFLGVVRNRPSQLQEKISGFDSLKHAWEANNSGLTAKEICDFEVSIARKSESGGYDIFESTKPWLKGSSFELDGFNWEGEKLAQEVTRDGCDLKRVYEVDMLVQDWAFDLTTPSKPETQEWMNRHERTLGRYLTNKF